MTTNGSTPQPQLQPPPPPPDALPPLPAPYAELVGKSGKPKKTKRVNQHIVGPNKKVLLNWFEENRVNLERDTTRTRLWWMERAAHETGITTLTRSNFVNWADTAGIKWAFRPRKTNPVTEKDQLAWLVEVQSELLVQIVAHARRLGLELPQKLVSLACRKPGEEQTLFKVFDAPGLAVTHGDHTIEDGPPRCGPLGDVFVFRGPHEAKLLEGDNRPPAPEDADRPI